ncbi:unnamed protein product [Eruca vesicaria subsp. sativa]|uniref:Phosphoinositide phospholipase C n=1 Tax=Eruca vesicaria subsp. sativa TaxID=29727 RepID=A0ABC8KXB8_ERUVS|nr:unnamed protein product [Eruca vesicaria subsp. sativa]
MIFTKRFKKTKKLFRDPNPDDVIDAFETYTDGETEMTPDQLQCFLKEVQGQLIDNTTDRAKIKRIVEEVIRERHPVSTSLRWQALTFDDFAYYLFSYKFNPAVSCQVHQDMTAPLTHYFIYASHYSYLTGFDRESECGDEPIIKDLRSGVRAIDLDLWSDANDNILVAHGRNLWKHVELGKCLQSIKDNAFVSSAYPVIITLGDNLTPIFRTHVVKMITRTFGDMLYNHDPGSSKEYPSPEELKFRILISTKPPHEQLDADDVKGKDSEQSIFAWMMQNDHEKVCYQRLIAIHYFRIYEGIQKVWKFQESKNKWLSLTEQSLEKVIASYGTDVTRFTQRNFLRIYPKGSTNKYFNCKPRNSWMNGAQMIAFNMQGYGEALWLMHGMFRGNGGCGYIKKPDLLMNFGPSNDFFDPKENLRVKKTLKVKVLIGDGWHIEFMKNNFDHDFPPSLYIKMGIAGAPADEIMKTGYNEFSFPLTVPELALLRVTVHDLTGEYGFPGQTCLPVSELRQGIRAVPLFDKKGDKLSSIRLLMRFDFL